MKCPSDKCARRHAECLLGLTIKQSRSVKKLDATDVRGLLSLLLADGSLVPYRSPGGGYIQLTLTAGAAESAFLEEKVAEFRQFVPTQAQIVHYKTKPRSNGKSTSVLRFRVSSTRLRPVYNLLYPAGEREISQTALDMLGAQAAAWLWAEGARLHPEGYVDLARVGKTFDEALRVCQWIGVLTGAEATLADTHIHPRLRFQKREASKIRKALLPYAPASRTHLFKEEAWDVSLIRSARTELLLGAGDPWPQGSEEAALARDQAPGDGPDLSEPPTAHAPQGA